MLRDRQQRVELGAVESLDLLAAVGGAHAVGSLPAVAHLEGDVDGDDFPVDRVGQ